MFRKEGIDVSHIVSDPVKPSGVALITVDARGENSIVIASGANATLSASDLMQAEVIIKQSMIALLQL